MGIELTAREQIILSIDATREEDAERLAGIAQDAGARFVKLGLELVYAPGLGPDYCEDLAARHNLDWVADAKLKDIGNTVEGAVGNLVDRDHPPFGITMHTDSSMAAMEKAQQRAGDTLMLGVTVLTDIAPEEVKDRFAPDSEDKPVVVRNRLVLARARDAARAGLKGFVSSPNEVLVVKTDDQTRDLFAMIPSTRSAGVDSHDQANVGTPTAAIRDGADLLVIGRQITKAENPSEAYEALVAEIEAA